MRPDGYPLPWCDELDLPWWQINLKAIATVQGWMEWQAQKRMNVIIPVLRWLLIK